MPEQQTGVVGAAQGETLRLPSGEIVEGAAEAAQRRRNGKPRKRQGLIAKGLITDQDVADIVMGEHELVDVLVDGKPVKMTRGEAARRGLTPVLSKDEVIGTADAGPGRSDDRTS